MTNAAETVLDLLVKHGWIEDDNASEVIPVFCPALYSKERPGVVIAPLR